MQARTNLCSAPERRGDTAAYVFSVFDECLPLPARHERGEGRGGGSPNPNRRCSLLSSLRGREGEKNCGTLNRYAAARRPRGVPTSLLNSYPATCQQDQTMIERM